MAEGAIGNSCQLRSRSSFNPWKSPASINTLAPPVSSRYLEPVTVRAAPRNVSFTQTSCEQPDLAAGVPEEHRFVRGEDAAANVRDQAGHRLGRIGGIEKEP